MDAQLGRGRALAEVFRAFLRLGFTSFGGPTAHVGYFRTEFVTRRGWLDEAGFAGWVALCQFLPGPSSTQLAFCLGWIRAGFAGAWLAFLAFMAPSGLTMALLAWGLPRWETASGIGAAHGLKVAAWAVVGHAVAGMARSLSGAWAEAVIAVCAGAMAWAWPDAASLHPLLVPAGAAAGACWSRREAMAGITGGGVRMRPLNSVACMVVAVGLLAAGSMVPPDAGRAAFCGALYRAGALVFGGGHVVLPFLEDAVVGQGWCTRDDFLAGYGAAQAMPGPMFTLAAYLGMRAGGWTGALQGMVAIFLPGLLLVSAVAPSWAWLSSRRWAARAVSGAGAAVVGLLGAAWVGWVWPGAIHGWGDLALGGAAWAALASGRVSPAWVVAGCAAWGGWTAKG